MCLDGGNRCGKCESCHKRRRASRLRIKNARRAKRRIERKTNHTEAVKKIAAKTAK
jgi:hypothetical protein